MVAVVVVVVVMVVMVVMVVIVVMVAAAAAVLVVVVVMVVMVVMVAVVAIVTHLRRDRLRVGAINKVVQKATLLEEVLQRAVGRPDRRAVGTVGGRLRRRAPANRDNRVFNRVVGVVERAGLTEDREK